MAINIFLLLGLATNTLISTLALNNKTVLAEFSVIPSWNLTINQTDPDSCHLDLDSNKQDVIKFTGSSSQTCGIQLEISNGTAAVLIHIPKDISVYAERLGKILDCQKKYIAFNADETCFVVFQHPQVQLFMEATDHYDDSIAISNLPLNDSSSICPKYTSNEEQRESRVSQITHCYSEDSDELFSCQLSPDYTCSFKFPANCNVILDKRLAKFHCSGDDLLLDRDAIIVYPPGIITLNLSKRRITEIKGSPFSNLKSLNKLVLDTNKLTTLNPYLFKGLNRLRELNLKNNELKYLPRSIFSKLVSLEKLHLGKNKLSGLDKTVFVKLRNLTKLYLHFNCLTILPTELFRSLINLEYLNLKENKLTLLHDNVFRETVKLTNLNLRNNSLSSLRESIFMTTNLTYLNLRHNKLKKLPKLLLRGQQKKNELYLYGNQLQTLSDNLFLD